MSRRVLVKSDTENHAQFSVFKAYYPHAITGPQSYHQHLHNDLEIACMVSGSGVYCCNGVDYEFQEGDIFLHLSNTEHYFKEIFSGDRPTTLAVRFDPHFIYSPGAELFNSKYLEIFNQKDLPACKLSFDLPVAGVVRDLLEGMFQECMAKEPSYELFVKSDLYMILSHLARNFHSIIEQGSQPMLNKRHLSLMENSMNYILSHLDEHLTLDQLAKEACMSRSYYSTIFKTLNGVSVWDYITTQRINLAKIQLETTSKSVMQICESCGFSSIANFNRAFKKLTGKTPRDYRKQSASTSVNALYRSLS